MTRTERVFRTPAIIIKRRDFNEADRLLTVLTPRHGKLDVIAKGARKLTSTTTGHVELFTRADMLIHRGRDLGIAQQAEMVMPYQALREDLQLGAYAAYAAEMMDRFTASGEEDHVKLFKLLDDTLDRLCKDNDPRLAIRYYEMHLLGWVGFQPELHQCVLGREPIMPVDQFFSYAEGGVVCPQHAVKNTLLMPVSMVTLKLLRHLQRSTYPQIQSLKVAPMLHNDAERLMLGYISYLLERQLQSVDFLRLVRS